MDEKQQKLLWERTILEIQIKGTRLNLSNIDEIKVLAKEQAAIERQMLILNDNNIIG